MRPCHRVVADGAVQPQRRGGPAGRRSPGLPPPSGCVKRRPQPPSRHSACTWNGQLEETIPAASGQESGTWEGTGTVSCAAGDQLEVRFFCVDGLGLGYEFPVRTWTVKEDRLAPGWPVTNTPVLVWP